MLLILSENWTLADGRDLPTLVRWARQAEDAAQKEESRGGDIIGARARLAAAHAAEDSTMQYVSLRIQPGSQLITQLREKNLTVQQTLFRKMREAFYML